MYHVAQQYFALGLQEDIPFTLPVFRVVFRLYSGLRLGGKTLWLLAHEDGGSNGQSSIRTLLAFWTVSRTGIYVPDKNLE
jgi:hypothetical protein